MIQHKFKFSAESMNESDPAPFNYTNSQNQLSPWLIACDHASNIVPKHMHNLGLSSKELSRHIGWDIGALGVARELSKTLDAHFIFGNYSRLIVDLNRPPSSPTFIPEVADDTPIPANINITKNEINARAKYFHFAYHRKIELTLNKMIACGIIPIIIAIHSFTPIFQNFQRPWHIGLLFEHDQRLVEPLKRALLLQKTDLNIGYNQPYAISGPSDHTIPVHGQARGLPHIEIEIRQDLIKDQKNQKLWGLILANALLSVVEENQPFKIIRQPVDF